MLKGLRCLLLTFLFLPFGLCSQSLTLGAIGGTNLTEDVHTGRQVRPAGPASSTAVAVSGGHNAIFGLTAEFRIRDKWALEFDALHRELSVGFGSFVTLPDGQILFNSEPNHNVLASWEFPLLAKRRFAVGKRQVFVTAGPSFRPASRDSDLSHLGGTIGGGIDLRKSGWRVSPTLRYTRWAQGGSFGPDQLGRPQLNQLELLVGLDRPSNTEAISAFGQPLKFGFILGFGLGNDFDPANLAFARVPESNSPIFGAAIEARLHENWSLEVDALYRALHGTDNRTVPGQEVRFAHLTWEFPVLFEYRFRTGTKLRPVLEAGPSFRAEGNINLNRVSHFGATAGIGLERGIGPIRVIPAVRYTRWAEGESGPNSRTKADQIQILISVSH